MNNTPSKQKTVKDSYYTLNMRIKGILNEIIDLAYENDKNISRYKAFRFYVVKKERSSKSGTYYCEMQKIEVFNPSLGARHLAKTALHELAHHIEYVKTGDTGHQKSFYEEYRRLIYASMDLGILEKEDFKDSWSSDHNKVWKIVTEYVPNPRKRKEKVSTLFKVYNGFTVKNVLKSAGYGWNGLEMTWEKETETPDEEVSFLIENGIEEKNVPSSDKGVYFVQGKNDMKIAAILKITATGNTYECRDVLKKYGFQYYGDKKVWAIKILADQWKAMEPKIKRECLAADVKFTAEK